MKKLCPNHRDSNNNTKHFIIKQTFAHFIVFSLSSWTNTKHIVRMEWIIWTFIDTPYYLLHANTKKNVLLYFNSAFHFTFFFRIRSQVGFRDNKNLFFCILWMKNRQYNPLLCTSFRYTFFFWFLISMYNYRRRKMYTKNDNLSIFYECIFLALAHRQFPVPLQLFILLLTLRLWEIDGKIFIYLCHCLTKQLPFMGFWTIFVYKNVIHSLSFDVDVKNQQKIGLAVLKINFCSWFSFFCFFFLF